MRVAIVGTVGYPANYGGFETLVKFLVENKSTNLEYTVFCDTTVDKRTVVDDDTIKRCFLPLKANGWQSIVYDALSIILACFLCKRILILGTSGTFILPFVKVLFPGRKFITNMAGLEWSREKWGKCTQKFLKLNEAYAVKFSNLLIADNQGLVDYVAKEYKSKSVCIAYGGSQYANLEIRENISDLHFLPDTYDLAMARCQKDNNIELILDAYANTGKNIVFVSNWDNSSFSLKILKKFEKYNNIMLVGPYYDPLYVRHLFSYCRAYIHGHQSGGTNPVLVEAIFHQKPIVAFDVSFNRYTTFDQALYFNSAHALENIIIDLDENIPDQQSMYQLGMQHYQWDHIVEKYENVIAST